MFSPLGISIASVSFVVDVRPSSFCCKAVSLEAHPMTSAGPQPWYKMSVRPGHVQQGCFVSLFPSGGPLLYSDVKFVYNSQQLNGTQRVLLDNVISEEQCRELHRVASVSGLCLWGMWLPCGVGIRCLTND